MFFKKKNSNMKKEVEESEKRLTVDFQKTQAVIKPSNPYQSLMFIDYEDIPALIDELSQWQEGRRQRIAKEIEILQKEIDKDYED